MPEALRKRLRLDPQDVLPTTDFELASATDAMSAFEQICLAIPASAALIAVRDDSHLRCVGSLGDAPEVGSRLPPDFAMAFQCLESGSVVFSEFTDDAQRHLHVGLTIEGVSHVRSAVALPMHAAGAIIGLIAVFSQRESSIQPRDVKALSRIADFWGPLMADEWFPEGIPAAITANAADDAAVAELSSPAEESLTVEVAVSPEAPHLSEPERAPEEPIAGDRVSSPESAEAPPQVVEVETQVAPTNPPASDPEPPLTAEACQPEELANPPEIVEPPRASGAVIAADAGAIAQAAREPASPVFLAPAEPIPPEAFHSGEPQRLTWLVVLAVFLIVLIPFWYLRSHWNRSNVPVKNSVSASSTSPANNVAAKSNATSLSAPPAAPAKNLGAVSPENSSLQSAAKSVAPDEEMPKPLPDLNTPPPANNPPSAASSSAKPTLPALISRILKSPTAVMKSNSDLSEPAAPEITAGSEPPPPTESAPREQPSATSEAEAPSAAADPINPAGFQPPNFALAQTLKAHSGWVSSLAFSPNGTLASGSWDRTMKLWDLSSGREVRVAADKLKQVQAVAFSSDGKLLAVEDASDTVTIFDSATGQPVRELPTDKTVPSVGISWVYSIAFSPDARWLASAVDEKTVRVWDVTTGTKIRDLTGSHRPVVYVAFSPNGEIVATGNDEKSIQLWNVASGAPVTTLSGHKKVINAVAFSPDGKLLASASADKTIRIWDAVTGKHLRTLTGHQAAVSSISFSPDGRWLASGSWDKTVRIWNVADGKELQTLRPDARAIYSVTFDPHGRWLAAGSEDGGIEIWQWNRPATSNQSLATP